MDRLIQKSIWMALGSNSINTDACAYFKAYRKPTQTAATDIIALHDEP